MLVIDKYLVLLVWQSQILTVDLWFPALKNSSACLPSSFFDFLKSTPKARHHTSSYSLCGFSVWFSFQCREGKMVRCQIWCVSKLILHRLTLHWLHTKFMKRNKSTRSYFYQLYTAHPPVQQLCLQHILTMLAQTVGQSMGRVRWLSPALHIGQPWFAILCCRWAGEFSENKCILGEEKGWNIRRITDARKAQQIRSKLRASAILPTPSVKAQTAL